MKKFACLLIIACLASVISCNIKPDKVNDGSGSSTLGGGSAAAHLDSLKTIGTSANGQTPATTGTGDTVINGHLITADSAKKIKP